MKITKQMLEDWNACEPGYAWFMDRFPSGEADVQGVLNALAEDDQPTYATWLLSKGCATSEVVEVDSVSGCKNLFIYGRLRVKGSIEVSGNLLVFGSIKAGEGIKA